MKRAGDATVQSVAKMPRESRVVYIKNTPNFVHPDDLLSLASQCGGVLAHFFHDTNGSAYIEMDSTESAQALINTCHDPGIGGEPLPAQFSTRTSVSERPTQANSVLMLRMQSPPEGVVDCSRIRDLFEAHARPGKVLRIQLWGKDGHLYALVQMDCVESGCRVREALHGVHVETAPGCSSLLGLNYSLKDDIRLRNLLHGKDYLSNEGEGLSPPLSAPASLPSFASTPPAASPPGVITPTVSHHTGDGCMVRVGGVLDGTSVEALFRLFGTVGDVTAVRIQPSLSGLAYVQYRTPEMARKAVELLHGCPFYEPTRTLSVVPISGCITGAAEAHTAFYPEHHPAHRFTGRSSKNLENRTAPTLHLHISNIPHDVPHHVLESTIRRFSDTATVKWLPTEGSSSTQMCIVDVDTIRTSVATLIGLHTYEFPGYTPARGKGIAVTFSTRPGAARTAPAIPVVQMGQLIEDPTRRL